MKSTTTLLTVFLLVSLLFGCKPEDEKALKLTGKVIGAETDTIYLIKMNQDTRFDSLIKLPVNNGSFEYNHKLKNPELVNLTFAESVKSGAYKPMPVFLENQEIHVTIYPENEFDKNQVEGGELNASYREYKENFEREFNKEMIPLRDSLRLLFRSNNYHSEEAKELHEELKNSKNQDEKIPVYKKLEDLKENNLYLTPKAGELDNKLKVIVERQKQFQQSYIEENPSLVSYYFFLENLIYDKEGIDLKLAKKNYNLLSQANPDHPYNDLSYNLINAIENIKVGRKYIDFTAPALDSTQVKLSDKIDGKIALLDLWATWCGPCIAKSRTMVPLFNEFKDRGFTIVGVAGEFENTDRLEKFLENEKWPWIQLVELDRKNRIWEKYGIDRTGGALFLIDENGKIIAKDPTAQEVRRVLENRLN